MNYLFVVAHPDDESDAAGGTIHKLVSQGHHVAVAIMVSQAAARRNLSDTLATDEEKALAILADTFCQLFLTGRLTKIGSRSAYIMDISLEFRIFCHFDSFLQDRFMTPCLEDTSLMKGQGTEITAAEAAAIAGKTEFDLFQSRYTAFCIVHGMPGIRIRQIVNVIHFLLCQRLCRRILDDISSAAIAFCQWSGCERIRITVLNGKAFCINPLIRCRVLVRRKNDWFVCA
mgnify:CR=1 FL=1